MEISAVSVPQTQSTIEIRQRQISKSVTEEEILKPLKFNIRKEKAVRYVTSFISFLFMIFGAFIVISGIFVTPLLNPTVIHYNDVTAVVMRIHIAFGVIWLLLSTFQTWPYIRVHYMKWHKWIGGAAIGVGCGVGFSAIIAPFTGELEGGFGMRVGGVFGGIFMIHDLLKGVLHVKQKRVHLHRKYMIRAYGMAWSIILMRPLSAPWITFPFQEVLGVVAVSVFLCAVFVMNAYYSSTQVPYVTDSKHPLIIQPSSFDGHPALSFSNNFLPCKLIERTNVGSDSALITLSLPKHYANIRVADYPGLHFALKAVIKGEEQIRFYTPIDFSISGQIKFLVKNYKEGIMSNFLHTSALDTEIMLQGPLGNFSIEQNDSTNLILFAAGSGVTPIFSVIKSWKKSAPRLLYSVGSAEEENYPLQKELENLKNSNQLNLTVCTDREKWEQLAFSQFEGLNPSFCQILICGPNSYMDCCLALANSKNINRKNVFAFGFDDH